MSVKVLTLFGEEIIPEKVKPEPKKAAVKKAVVKTEEDETDEEPLVKAHKPKAEKAVVKEKEPGQPVSLSNFNGEKQYYTIGEVSALFKVKTSNIRFWTKEFD